MILTRDSVRRTKAGTRDSRGTASVTSEAAPAPADRRAGAAAAAPGPRARGGAVETGDKC